MKNIGIVGNIIALQIPFTVHFLVYIFLEVRCAYVYI